MSNVLLEKVSSVQSLNKRLVVCENKTQIVGIDSVFPDSYYFSSVEFSDGQSISFGIITSVIGVAPKIFVSNDSGIVLVGFDRFVATIDRNGSVWSDYISVNGAVLDIIAVPDTAAVIVIDDIGALRLDLPNSERWYYSNQSLDSWTLTPGGLLKLEESEGGETIFLDVGTGRRQLLDRPFSS